MSLLPFCPRYWCIAANANKYKAAHCDSDRGTDTRILRALDDLGNREWHHEFSKKDKKARNSKYRVILECQVNAIATIAARVVKATSSSKKSDALEMTDLLAVALRASRSDFSYATSSSIAPKETAASHA